MSISTVCPQCQSQFQYADDAAGKQGRCQRCQHVFVIGAAPVAPRNDTIANDFDVAPADAFSAMRASPSSHPARDEDASTSRRPLRRKDAGYETPGWFKIALGVGGLFATGAIVLMIVLSGDSSPPPDKQPVVERPEPKPKPKPDLEPKPEPDPSKVAWTVKPDPLPPNRGPFDTTTSIQVGAGGAEFPSTPSPFVALSPIAAKGQEAVIQVHDLRTMKAVGKPIPRRLLTGNIDLSHDGKYLSSLSSKATVDVFSTAEGKRIQSISLEVEKPVGRIHMVDFGGKDQLFTVTGEAVWHCRTWDLTTGRMSAEFTNPVAGIDVIFSRKWAHFSPGHRYYVVQETAGAGNGYHLHFFDLTTGKLAGKVPMQEATDKWGQCAGIAFSADGEELTLLWRLSGADCWARMMTFDLKTGRKLRDLEIPRIIHQVESLWLAGGVNCLQYAPDRGRWLLFNHLLVDSRTGNVVGTVGNAPATRRDIVTRRFLDAEHYVEFIQDARFSKTWHTKVEALPPRGTFVVSDRSPAKVYLSDLEPVEAVVGWGKFGRKGQLGYGVKRGETDRKIKVAGKEDPNGLSMHPPGFNQSSFVKYQLNGRAKTLRAAAAINDLEAGEKPRLEAPLTFRVIGDGRELWQSPPLQTLGKPEQCQVDVTGVRVLELQVLCPRGQAGASAVWLDAHVLR